MTPDPADGFERHTQAGGIPLPAAATGVLADRLRISVGVPSRIRLIKVGLEVIVVKPVPHDKKTSSSLDAIVGEIAMFVEGRLVAFAVLIEAWRDDQAVLMSKSRLQRRASFPQWYQSKLPCGLRTSARGK